MSRKFIVVVFIQLCFLFVSSGQDSISNKPLHLFGIYTGYSRHIIKDEVASPLIYSGTKAPFVFTYKYIGNKSRQFASFYINNLELNSSITNKSGYYLHYADNLNAELEYSYNRKAFSIKKIKTDCFLGGKFLSVLNYRNFHYYSGNSILFAEQLNSIGVNFLMEKKVGAAKNDFLRFNINLPLFAYVVLNDRYNAVVSETFNKIDLSKNIVWQIFTKGDVVTVNKLFEYQTELTYTKLLTKHLGIEFEHRLHFYYFSQFENLLHARYLSNQVLIGLIVKL